MRPPRPLRALLLAALLATAASAPAQDAAPAFEPRTGDAWVDTWLADINRYGATYREPFVDEMARYHGAPRELVAELLGRPGWTPGDVYFACALAVASGRPCRFVVDAYERDRAGGWGAVTKGLGIEPGSPAFQRLKRGFVPTYDRWGRPLQLDAELERAFPGRPRMRAPARPAAEAPATARPEARAPARPAQEEPRRPPATTGERPAAPKGRGGGKRDGD